MTFLIDYRHDCEKPPTALKVKLATAFAACMSIAAARIGKVSLTSQILKSKQTTNDKSKSSPSPFLIQVFKSPRICVK